MYQGRLNNGGTAANGSYDFRFALYDSVTNGSLIAGPVTNTATAVADASFSVILDFGPGLFPGPAQWVDVAVRTNGAGAFAALIPRQPILAVPYAIFAYSASNLLGTVAAAQLSGPLTLAQLPGAVLTNNEKGITLGGAFSGSGAGLTGLNALTNCDNATFIAMAKALEAGDTFGNWGRFSW